VRCTVLLCREHQQVNLLNQRVTSANTAGLWAALTLHRGRGKSGTAGCPEHTLSSLLIQRPRAAYGELTAEGVEESDWPRHRQFLSHRCFGSRAQLCQGVPLYPMAFSLPAHNRHAWSPSTGRVFRHAFPPMDRESVFSRGPRTLSTMDRADAIAMCMSKYW
jgi:hypothetical protein